MLKSQLIKKSPIRVLDKTIHGGLGAGNLGAFTARKGVGKTASLVHVATDKMLRGEKVLHISYADDPNHIESWYKQVFNEVASFFKLEDAHEIYEQLLQQRLILHFKQKEIEFSQIKEDINQISKNVPFHADTIIVDGYSLEDANKSDVENWKELANEKNQEIWFSSTLHRENLQLDENGIPAPVNKFPDLFSVIIMLVPQPNHVDFHLLKAHNDTDLEKLRLKLDPKTMLIANHRV